MTSDVTTEKKGPWAIFSVADETFAVSVEDVQEVMLQQPLTPVPLAPPYISGLLNLRGQVMPAIDLRKRLGFDAREEGAVNSLLVLKTKDALVSVVVDSIGDVLDLDNSHWELPPETLAAQHRSFVFGIYPLEHDVLLGLRVEVIVGEDEQQRQGS